MKVLYCHNYYRNRGGEDVSFEADVEMLRDYGHEVVTLTRDNLEMSDGSPLKTARQAFWNSETEQQAQEIIERERPDIMHCNNLFPQISPSIYRPAKRAGIPVVQAMRNYRYFCAKATTYRDGKVCTDCIRKSFAFPAVRHACYRDSRKASTIVAAMHAYHRAAGTWQNYVDAFFSPTHFAKGKLIEAGLPADKFHVKSNFVHPDHGTGSGDGGYALFVGRITLEKGTETMAEAWTKHAPQLPLLIAGEGDSQCLDDAAKQTDQVRRLGRQSYEEVLSLMGNATCLIFPSRWYETFGRTIAEAFSRGTPVISSDLGAMPELIDHNESGLLFPPGDAAALAECVNQLASDPNRLSSMRDAARESYEIRFTREVSYHQLMKIYHNVLGIQDTHQEMPLQASST